ncbi:MAG TPA: hypothetical protein VGM05_27710 [Planctomycetaceae bacterium]|jgi:hypothetical protein
MNRNRWTTLGLGTALLVAVALSAFNKSLDAQDKQDKKAAAEKNPARAEANNPFAGKVLLIQKKFDNSPAIVDFPNVLMEFAGFVIENASVTEVAGIHFLSGYGIERVDGKPVGPRISMPLESVGAILEFDNADAYKQFEEQQAERIQNMRDLGQPVPIEILPPAAAPDA